ncbi:altronate oxidoreductase [Thalassobacillus devorans]|uniref:Altronate oxidoreductase n=1 Tax=Thalassobacillus devorans TaxID=279813 RepID=A0ABQ1NU60_9BACI|nr:tagaturonate reductase [Thalassobacillus devorans]NIK28718.1 tagaturonate reductase [Thalassobacillus devorans]GGC84090.1 altronate oxidoreductase [Thalassobacillus devorans]
MQGLNKSTIQDIEQIEDVQRDLIKKELPERIVQFGEGNFLRLFIDWMIQQLNKQGLFNGRVVAIQPTPHGKVVPKLDVQDGLYTTILQGIQDGEEKQEIEINSAISRGLNPYEDWKGFLDLAESDDIEFVFSNTTEAGLTYREEEFPDHTSPLSFPAKLTALLYRRFTSKSGNPNAGLVIIPCELVEENGKLLRSLVLRAAEDWELPEAFVSWVNDHNNFCDTLVDRIVPGYPRDTAAEWEQQLGYQDMLMSVGEPFHLFVIETEEELEDRLPFQKGGLHVKWSDVKPYRDLKVSVLNAPHTMIFSVGYLSGLSTVYEVMEDSVAAEFVDRAIYQEILPNLSADKKEKESFAVSVIERFQNPFVKHQLTDLGLNAVYKYRTRVLPLLNSYTVSNGEVPPAMCFSLAALFHYYKPDSVHEGHFLGKIDGKEYKVRDDQEAMDVFIDFWNKDDQITLKERVNRVLENEKLWGQDLTRLPDMTATIVKFFEEIREKGAKKAVETILNLQVENQK